MKRILLLITICLSSMSFGQNVNIPDPNFKASLLSNPNINTNGDTEIQVSEASSYDDILGCFSCQISDLTGVEYFENVTNMQFDQNLLTSADFSGCAALESLSLYSNNLTSINISQNQRLKSLDVMSNDLTAINLTNNDSLVLLNLITIVIQEKMKIIILLDIVILHLLSQELDMRWKEALIFSLVRLNFMD